MSKEIIGLIFVGVLMVMILLRVPVAVALGIAGFLGYAAVDGWHRALLKLGETPYDLAFKYDLSVVPLFILMGVVCTRAGMSRELFAAANAMFTGRRGALAMATIGACAGFGAICGSSLATAATLTKVAVPEMRRYGYDPRLAAGCVASGGTLGILIPPSVILVIYGLIAEESIAKLYAAALFPGLLLAALHVLVIIVLVRLNPAIAPISPAMPGRERWVAVAQMWKIVLLFGLAVGGIYAGIFSPTEAAAVGAFAAILIASATGTFGWADFRASVLETVFTTASLFFIVVGALIFAYFVVQTNLPRALIESIGALGVAPWVVILLLVAFYLVAGCFLDSISMILITIPVFLPLVKTIGYDPIWFGILVVVAVEMGLITPPVGMNCFIVRAQIPDIPLGTVFRGVAPFLSADFALIFVLLVLPQIALWLPKLLY